MPPTSKSKKSPAPAKDAPAKGAPSKGTLSKGAPAKVASAKGTLSKGAPAKVAPAKDAPSKGAPSKGAPKGAGKKGKEPGRARTGKSDKQPAAAGPAAGKQSDGGASGKQSDGGASGKQSAAASVSGAVFIKRSSDLNALLVSAIKDMYWAENHLVAALPKIWDAAGMAPLKKAIANHLEVTINQALRLEKIFALLGEQPQAKRCDAMVGLVLEGEAVIHSTKAGSAARDMGLIMFCRRVENYEMAAYQGLATLATNLGMKEVTKLLDLAYQEESESDGVLLVIAERNF